MVGSDGFEHPDDCIDCRGYEEVRVNDVPSEAAGAVMSAESAATTHWTPIGATSKFEERGDGGCCADHPCRSNTALLGIQFMETAFLSWYPKFDMRNDRFVSSAVFQMVLSTVIGGLAACMHNIDVQPIHFRWIVALHPLPVRR